MNYNKGIYVKFARCFYFEIPTKGNFSIMIKNRCHFRLDRRGCWGWLTFLSDKWPLGHIWFMQSQHFRVLTMEMN